MGFDGRGIAIALPGLLACGCTRAAREDAAAADGSREAVAVVRACPPRDVPASAALEVRRNLAYRTVGGDALRLDIARLPGAGARPLVVLLHGGGWEGGGRGSMDDEMLLLAAQGYAAATVSYRLTSAGRNVFPAAVQDVRCAVRWLRANAARYGIDPRRVGVLGFSAGGHLASILGVGADLGALDEGGPACAEAAESPAVQAVVSVAGPHDLRVNGPYTREQARLVTNFLGVFPGDDPQRAALASPVTHVRPGVPPFLLVQGARDDLVPPAQARAMRDALQAAGARATLLELARVGHAFVPLDSRAEPRVGCTVMAFLRQELGED
ncbi:MAG: alpha/beta hydrolase fold domain-containing protein [Gemmatimonadaceae bacterium]